MSKASKSLLIIGLVACLLVLGAAPATAGHSGERVYVDKSAGIQESSQDGSVSAPFDTIQEGINHASAGDTVVVGVDSTDDTYTGANSTVVLNKSVVLVNANGTATLDGTGTSGPAITVANDSGSITDAAVVGFTIENHSGPGVAVQEDDLANLSVRRLTVRNVSESGVSVQSAGTLENISVRNNTFENFGPSTTPIQAGVLVDSQGTVDRVGVINNTFTGPFADGAMVARSSSSGTLSDLLVAGNNASDVDTSLVVEAQANSTVSGANVTLNEFTNATDAAIRVAANDDGVGADATVHNVSITENALNESASNGVFVTAAKTGNVSDLSISTNNLSNNQAGVEVDAQNQSSVGDVTVYNNRITNSDYEAVDVDASQSSMVADLTVEQNALNESLYGVAVRLTDSATGQDIVIEENDIRNNSYAGGIFRTFDTATLQNLTVTNVDARDSDDGLAIVAGETASDDATVRNVTITENALNETDGYGIYFLANGTSSFEDLTVRTNNLSNNNGSAAVFQLDASSRLSNATVTETVTAGSERGVWINAGNKSTDATTLEHVTVTDNLLNETNSSGLSIEAQGSGTVLQDVSVTTNDLSNNPYGLFIGSRQNATVRNITVDEARVINSSYEGIRIRAGLNGTDEAVIENVSITDALVNSTATNAIDIRADKRGRISDIDVRRAILAKDNGDGLLINATSTARIEDVALREVLIQNTTDDALDIDVSATASHGNVSVRQSLIRDSGGASLEVNATTDPDGISIHRVLFEDNTDGVLVQNASGVVDARYTYWGDSTGPSSPGSTTLTDPVTGVPAAGDGDPVSDADNDGVAEVRFSPGIGGKLTTGSQLIDPIPEETVNVTVQGVEISGELTHFVGIDVWERSLLPLRRDPGTATTRVTLPDLFIESGGNTVSANRNEFAVYNPGTQVTLNYDRVSGADTTRYANEDVQLLILRTNGTATPASVFDTETDVNTTSGEAIINTTAATVVANKSLSTDGNGELQTSFTPQSSGTYTAVLTTPTTGDGLTAQDGRLSLDINNDTTTVIGLEQIFVQTQASSVTPNKTTVQQGTDVAFTANSGLSGSDIAHVVTAYDRSKFVNEDITVTGNDLTNTSTGFLFTINGKTGGSPFFISLNVSDNGTVTGIDTNASFPVDASAETVESGSGTETLVMPVGPNASLAEDTSTTYQYFHAAVDNNNVSKFATSTGTLTVKNDTFRFSNPTIGDTSLTAGDSTTISVTVENTGTQQSSTTVDLAVDGTVTNSKTVTLNPGKSTTVSFTRTFNSAGSYAINIGGLNAGTIDVTEDTTTSPPPSDDDDDDDDDDRRTTRPPNVVVETSGNGAQVTIRRTEAGQAVEVEVPDQVEDGTGVTRLRFTSRIDASNVQINITRQRATPTEGAPQLESETNVPAVRYLSISANVPDEDIESVEVDFRVNPNRLPEGATAGDGALYRYNNGQWNELPTSYNEGTGEYTSVSPGFTAYAVGATQQQAQFEVTDASVAETSLTVGQETTASATVENVGEESGTYTAELTVDGSVVQSQEVTLDAGESTDVEFTVSFDEAGSYDVAVSGQTAGTITVEAADTTTSQPTTTTGPSDEDGNNLPLIIVVVLIVLLAAGAIYYFTQQQG